MRKNFAFALLLPVFISLVSPPPIFARVAGQQLAANRDVVDRAVPVSIDSVTEHAHAEKQEKSMSDASGEDRCTGITKRGVLFALLGSALSVPIFCCLLCILLGSDTA